MAKQQTSLQYIYKINSSRLKRNKWNLKLSIDEARKNNELIPLADSQALRFVRDITNTKFSEDEVQKIKSEIKRLKRLPTCIEGRRKIRELYRMLDSILFVKDYIFVVMANNKDYDRANKGFFINGIKYKRLLATTGGAKNSTIIYVSESIYPELNKRIENGRDVTKPLVPGKLEAYKALTCSASIPVSNPKGILVV
jgi:hypothetical protein